MAKTKKFFIETSIADGLLTKVEVTEKKFKAALQSAEMQYKAQASQQGDDFYVGRNEKEYDHGEYKENIVIFEWSISSIWFRTLTCAAGRKFVR